MEYINKEDLRSLAEIQAANCISIYIPTHQKGREVFDGQDQILLKNQVQKAKAILGEKGLQDVQIVKLLKPVTDLLDDNGFWRHQSSGLAIFLNTEFFKYYRLPHIFQEECTVSNSFRLKQLLPLLNGNGEYYVLSISLTKTKFYRANRDNIEELSLGEDVPDSLEESMKYTEIEKSVQFHSGAGPGGFGANSGRGASGIFHGQAKGIQRDDRKIFIGEFFRKLDHGVFEVLKEKDAPLVLVGVDYLHPMYKSESSVKTIFGKGIETSPDEIHVKDIHSRTWEIIEPHFNKEKEEIINKYNEFAGTGKTSNSLKNVITAAVNGRVESIFIAKNACKWGIYKEDGADLIVDIHSEYQENDDCLISMAAVSTVLNGGKAFLVEKEELPEQSKDTDVVAVYRY
ncbi:MAG: hypothetical protein M3421_06065 [Bacteroidota bacterium]|nr:hypothetical protein [Bacteroidota bacterium]